MLAPAKNRAFPPTPHTPTFLCHVFSSLHCYLQPFKPICYYAIKQRLALLAPAKSRALTATPHRTPAFFCASVFSSQTAYSTHSSAKRHPAFAPQGLSHPHPAVFVTSRLFSYQNIFSNHLSTKHSLPVLAPAP